MDGLLNYWVALETLAKTEGKKAAGSILGHLATIHGLTTQRAGETFPIDGVYKMRKKIIHQGELVNIHGGLLDFLSDVFFDTLIHVLDLTAPLRTQIYLDGSANQLVRR